MATSYISSSLAWTEVLIFNRCWSISKRIFSKPHKVSLVQRHVASCIASSAHTSAYRFSSTDTKYFSTFIILSLSPYGETPRLRAVIHSSLGEIQPVRLCRGREADRIDQVARCLGSSQIDSQQLASSVYPGSGTFLDRDREIHERL